MEENNINSNYILVYSDDNKIIDILINLNLNIIKILDINENKYYNFNENNLIKEYYNDIFIEYDLIKNADLIIYHSEFKKSNIIINSIQEFNKIIIFNNNINNLLYDIKLFLKKFNENNYINDEIINDNISNFIIHYNNLNTLKYKSIKDCKNNIKININKSLSNETIDECNTNIVLITYYKNTNLDILKTIQKRSIIENLNNNEISIVVVIGTNIKNELEDIQNSNIKDSLKYKLKLIEINNDNNNEQENDKQIEITNKKEKNSLNFYNILKFINNNYKNNIICLTRCDIIMNKNNIDFIDIELELDEKKIYAISRLDRLINGNIIKSKKLETLLFSTEQDAWIFKSPLLLDEYNIKILEYFNFYDKYSHLYFNKILKDNDYKIINNTQKFKFIRVLTDLNIDNRPIINDNIYEETYSDILSDDIDDIYLIPSNEIIDNISVEYLIKTCNLNKNDIYELKCELFNKYLKNKIINNV